MSSLRPQGPEFERYLAFTVLVRKDQYEFPAVRENFEFLKFITSNCT